MSEGCLEGISRTEYKEAMEGVLKLSQEANRFGNPSESKRLLDEEGYRILFERYKGTLRECEVVRAIAEKHNARNTLEIKNLLGLLESEARHYAEILEGWSGDICQTYHLHIRATQKYIEEVEQLRKSNQTPENKSSGEEN